MKGQIRNQTEKHHDSKTLSASKYQENSLKREEKRQASFNFADVSIPRFIVCHCAKQNNEASAAVRFARFPMRCRKVKRRYGPNPRKESARLNHMEIQALRLGLTSPA